MSTLADAINFFNRNSLREAEGVCRVIIEANPDHVEALNLLGSIKVRQQALIEARGIFERVAAIQPQSAKAISNLAWVMSLLNLPEETLDLCDCAIKLSRDCLEAWMTRGAVLFRSGRLQEALSSYDEALRISKDNVETLIGRGSVLAKLGRSAQAIVTLNRIPVAGNPAQLFNRANLKMSLGLFSEAIRDFRQLVSGAPQVVAAWLGLLNCAMETCDWPAADEARKNVLSALDAGAQVKPLTIFRISEDPVQHLKAARSVAPSGQPYVVQQARRGRPQKLRIAYLSPDFRVHPLAYLIPEMLEHHDRSRFEIVGISLGPDDGSDIRARIVGAFDQFHDANGKSDEEIVALARDLRIDVAIDLAGHTDHARPGVLARRIAPVQASYLGYCGTSGSNYIDYLIADETAVPPEMQRYFTESVAYLPNSFMAADSTQAVSEIVPARRDHGLPDRGFVFCCFNKNYKISRPVFETWMRVLKATPGSVLWLSSNQSYAKENLERHASAAGIDPRRIVFAPSLPRREDHLARHRLADLFLDTLPYNAHTTACDALFAGLPVLTVAGPTFVGRVGASMLRAMQLDELIARDLSEYEGMAIALANDPHRVSDIRAKCAAGRLSGALFKTESFCRNFEALLDAMSEIAGRGELPHSFKIDVRRPA